MSSTPPRAIACLPASSNNTVVLWDVDSGRKKVELSYRDQDFRSIAFSKDGRRLISLDEAGVVRHWDKTTGSLLIPSFLSATVNGCE